MKSGVAPPNLFELEAVERRLQQLLHRVRLLREENRSLREQAEEHRQQAEQATEQVASLRAELDRTKQQPAGDPRRDKLIRDKLTTLLEKLEALEAVPAESDEG